MKTQTEIKRKKKTVRNFAVRNFDSEFAAPLKTTKKAK